MFGEINFYLYYCAKLYIKHINSYNITEIYSWDETHFGKMGSWYINRTFFFDVHPPLGKVSSKIT